MLRHDLQAPTHRLCQLTLSAPLPTQELAGHAGQGLQAALPAGALFASAADVSVLAHTLLLELPPQPPCAAPQLLRCTLPWPWLLLQLALLPSPLVVAAAGAAWRHLPRLLRRGSCSTSCSSSAASVEQLLVSALLDVFEASGCREALLAANTLQLEVAGGAGPCCTPDWQAAAAGGPVAFDKGALAAVLQQLPRRVGVVALAAPANVPKPEAPGLQPTIPSLMLCRRSDCVPRQLAAWARREREQRHPYWSVAVALLDAGESAAQLLTFLAVVCLKIGWLYALLHLLWL